MKFLYSLTTLIASLLLARDAAALVSFKPGLTWNYLLGVNDESVILSLKEQVLTIDLNRRHLVPKLHAKGQKVICYFSGGTLEAHRKDKADYEAVAKKYDGFFYGPLSERWEEQYIDFRMKDALRPLLENRMKLAIDAGCDAIEVDCLGAYNHEVPRKHGLTQEDSLVFAKWVSQSAHKLGIAIGLKNIATLAPQLINDFDFAVVESCSSSKNVCALYKDFPKQGKAVFTIHYGNYGSFSSQKSTMVQEQKGLGYTCIFNNDDQLDTPSYAYNCDTGSTTSTSGSIPKQETSKSQPAKTQQTTNKSQPSNNVAQKSAPAANAPAANTQAANTQAANTQAANAPAANAQKQTPSNNNSAGAVANNANTPAVPVNSPVANANTDGTNQPVLSNVYGDSANAGVPLDVAQNPQPTVQQNIPQNVQPQGAVTNKEVNEVDETEKEEKGNTGTTIAIVAAAGGIAAAAVGFVFLKKNDKFTDFKRNLTRRFTERKNQNAQPELESISYPENPEANYRYNFAENYNY